jgi:hypothetical protein
LGVPFMAKTTTVIIAKIAPTTKEPPVSVKTLHATALMLILRLSAISYLRGSTRGSRAPSIIPKIRY